jgi:hypothetical protein
MFKSLLTKGLVTALVLVCTLQSSFAQVFWSEGFSDQASATTNWVHGGTNDGPGGIEWTWTNDPDAGAFNGPWASAGAADGYFWFDSDGNGDGAHDVTLTNLNAPINCTGKTGVALKFRTFFRTFSAVDMGQVGVSTDGTNFTYYSVPQFDNLAANASFDGSIELDISAQADNQAQVWIQFRWVGQFEYYWKVDDVELSEAVATTSDITFRVNAALLTVDPAGMKIAGSFTNWADADMVNQGNGVWSYTATGLLDGTKYLYKFKNGPNGWESGQAACGESDGFGGFNRTITPDGTATLPAVCFNSCSACVLPCNLNPDAIICDNFESYNTAQKLGPQATWWTTWSGTEGTTEDGIVSTEQAASGTKSLKIVSTAATGGPQDVVLDLGNETEGRYELNWKMFVPVNKQGYYNCQNVLPVVNGDWSLNVFFNAAGAGQVTDGANAELATFTYPNGQWFDVKHIFDLDNNLFSITINGVLVAKKPYSGNLGGIDFFGVNASNQFYVDDVEYIELPALVYNADVCATAVDLTGSFGSAAGITTTVGPFDITNATLDPNNDPTEGFDCHFQGDPLQGNHWFTFTGTGAAYTITSSSCGATPITDNDTQFALYSGSCGDYTPIACNDDVGGANLSSTLTFETEVGVNYFLMVDSYDGLDGTYCLDITQVASVDCNNAAIGLNTVGNNGFICEGGNLNEIMDFDESTYLVPNLGLASGHLWCISTEPLDDPNVFPGEIAGIASTTASPNVILVNLPNDGSAFDPGTYYLTSVLIGNGTLIDPAAPARIFNIDISNGCFFVGVSHEITLLPALDPIIAFHAVSPGSQPNTINVDLEVTGGFANGNPVLYEFTWSNGATTPNLVNVPNIPDYAVTVSDISGCVEDFVITNIATDDPTFVKALQLTPNPTTGLFTLNLSMEKSADVQVDIFNNLGQLLQSIQAGNTAVLNRTVDLSAAPTGMYTVRIRLDNDTAVRRVSVQR